MSRLLTLLETYFGLLKLLPKHDIPSYFSKIILYIHRAYRYKVLENIKLPNPKLFCSDFFINLMVKLKRFFKITYFYSQHPINLFQMFPVPQMIIIHSHWQLDFHISQLDGPECGVETLLSPFEVNF